MELIIFIIIIAVVISKSKKQKGWRELIAEQTRSQTMQNQPRYQSVQNTQRSTKNAAELKNEIWERLSEESRAKMVNRDIPQRSVAGSQRVSNAYATGSQAPQSRPDIELTAAQQVQKRRAENRNTSILDRAKGHAEDRENDVTLQAMEAEHHHSERVAPAVHHHPEDVIPESMLGSVSDLMVKGYDGNLCFERDFLGEAMDMISHFTVPSEIPDFAQNEVTE